MCLVAENCFQIPEYNFFVYLNLEFFYALVLKFYGYVTMENKVIFL